MKLSLRTEYALRALIFLGLRSPMAAVQTQAIAIDQDLPKRYLEQIMNNLKAAGLLESKRGVGGGYRLKAPPNEITLAAVLSAFEGQPVQARTAKSNSRPNRRQPDEILIAMRSVLDEVRRDIMDVLNRVTIQDLCHRAQLLRESRAASTDYEI